VTQGAIVTQLFTLTTQVQSLPKSVATMLTSSSRPNRSNDGREPIVCT
jgi:hypothetical protein